MNNKQLEQIEKHGQQLNDIFKTGLDNVALCKKLHRLENKAHKIATDYCNGDINQFEETKLTSKIMTALKKVLFPDTFGSNPNLWKAVFINLDCRGYALKIKDSYVRENNLSIYKDWGGYGIICPEF